MGLTSFLNVLKNIRLQKFDDNFNKADKVYKIRYFFEYLKIKWQENFYPSIPICVDETIIPFDGKLAFKVSIRDKPHPTGIFMYTLADCKTFYMLNAEIFQGIKDDERKKPNERNFNIVNRLIEKYLDKKHIVYMDNYYTTIKLVDYLYTRDTGCVGTLRQNRTGENGLGAKMNKKDVRTYVNIEYKHLLLTIWFDSVLVQAISSCFPIKIITHMLTRRENGFKDCPLVFKEYNKYSVAIDKNNQLINYIKSPLKTNTWWLKAYWYLTLITITNAFLIYKHHAMKRIKKKVSIDILTRRQFMLSIIKELISQTVKNSHKKNSFHEMKYFNMLFGNNKARPSIVKIKENIKPIDINHFHFPYKSEGFDICEYNNCKMYTLIYCKNCTENINYIENSKNIEKCKNAENSKNNDDNINSKVYLCYPLCFERYHKVKLHSKY